MKRLLCAALALCLAAGSADARGLVIRNVPVNANTALGIERNMAVTLPMLNTLGGDYRAVNIYDAPPWATEALRRGVWYTGGSVNGDSALYNPIIIVGDGAGIYTTGTASSVGRQTSVGGYGVLYSQVLNEFAYVKPGMLVTGTGITAPAVVVSVWDSLGYSRARVFGTIAGGANITATFATPIRPDSLTMSRMYPKVTILRIGNTGVSSTGPFTTATTCSTGVGAQTAYVSASGHDSIWNAYEVGNVYRSWKSRVRFAANSPRDPRGWRPLLGAHTTRQNTVGYAGGNYDFPDLAVCPTCAYSTDPDTVGPVWAVMNNGTDGTPLGGNAKPNVYCLLGQGFASALEPGPLLQALGWADSLSGGGLFGTSQKLPRKFGIHIDDAWRRGDSRNGGAYGMISTNDTTAYKGSIDSLASLGHAMVVSAEPESLGSVLLAPGVTGDGRYYDQRWWARNPYAHYTPHCHAGITGSSHRAQNNGTKYLRVLDIFGLTRYRNVFGSVDSTLAYGLPDYVNEAVMDTGATYWLAKRALALCDSVFGRDKVDRLIMPCGDDWSSTNTKHTRFRQHALALDSTFAMMAALGFTGTRTNNNNVIGNDDSLVTNNFGYYPGYRRVVLPQYGNGGDHPAGMPTWMPASVYGRSVEILPTNGYPGGAFLGALMPTNGSWASWSHNRNTFGGDAFLRGLLCERVDPTVDPGAQRAIYILTSHTGDYGSSGNTNEETRPQFYTTKYVINQVRVANAHARRPLVQIVYPDQVSP